MPRQLRLTTEERDRLLDGGYSQIHFGAWMRLENDLRPRVRQADDHVRELEVGDRALRIAKVERMADSFRPLRAPEHAVDEILDVAPRADLRPVVVQRDRRIAERLQNYPANRAVADLPRTVHVKRTDDRQREPVF